MPAASHSCTPPCARPSLQGVDGGDVDLPTAWESGCVTNKFAKLCFNFIYLCIYGRRVHVTLTGMQGDGQAECR